MTAREFIKKQQDEAFAALQPFLRDPIGYGAKVFLEKEILPRVKPTQEDRENGIKQKSFVVSEKDYNFDMIEEAARIATKYEVEAEEYCYNNTIYCSFSKSF